MNQLIPTQSSESGNLLVSGRDLHEFLESNERYSKWFNRMTEYGFIENEDYTSGRKSTVVNNGAVRVLDDHLLTINMAKEIAMLQRNDKGKQARQYFLELERRWNSPEMVIKRAHEFLERKVAQLEGKIEQQQPLVSFAESCMASDKSILVRELAKLATKQGLVIGEVRLYEQLRQWGYIMKNSTEPTQRAMDAGYFEITRGVKEKPDGRTFAWSTTRVTPKGQIRIIDRLRKERSHESA